MHFSKIILIALFDVVFLLNNGIYGQKIDFPVQACASGAASGNYMMCIAQLAGSIWKLHNWSQDTPINICGIECAGNLKGRISKLKWKWDGRFRCDSKAPDVVGQDSKKSRNGAMEWAIRDFLNKAIVSGQIKAQDFQC